MEVIVLQVFCSFLLVGSSLLLFALSAKHREHEHHDRLALLPIERERVHSHVLPSIDREESAHPGET